MKQIAAFLFFALVASLNNLCFGQIQPMGFTQQVVIPPSNRFLHAYRPKLTLLDDTLYVCSNTGVYRKNLRQNTGWELYAFENIPVIEFVKNGNNLLAISPGTKDGRDSLMFSSAGYNSYFLYGGNAIFCRIHQ